MHAVAVHVQAAVDRVQVEHIDAEPLRAPGKLKTDMQVGCGDTVHLVGLCTLSRTLALAAVDCCCIARSGHSVPNILAQARRAKIVVLGLLCQPLCALPLPMCSNMCITLCRSWVWTSARACCSSTAAPRQRFTRYATSS